VSTLLPAITVCAFVFGGMLAGRGAVRVDARLSGITRSAGAGTAWLAAGAVLLAAAGALLSLQAQPALAPALFAPCAFAVSFLTGARRIVATSR
jgi:hypothetical protein